MLPKASDRQCRPVVYVQKDGTMTLVRVGIIQPTLALQKRNWQQLQEAKHWLAGK